MCRIKNDFQKRGGMDEKLTQAFNGRLDLYRLYKNVGEKEMQTVVRDPKDLLVEAVLIKIHDKKPTPDCSEYKQIHQLLESLQKEIDKQNRHDTMNSLNKDEITQNLSKDDFMKVQLMQLEYYKKKKQKQDKKIRKNKQKSYNFKDDDQIAQFNLKNFKFNGQDLNLQFVMTPLKVVKKAQKYGKCLIPFTVSLNARYEIPDYIAQQNVLVHQRAPIDIVMCIDKSGSMAGSKLAILLKAINIIMEKLTQNDRLALVTFSTTGQRLLKLTRLTPQNKNRIKQKLLLIKAIGGTNIAEAMDISLNVLSQRRYKNPVTSILLLSDGLDDGATGRVKTLIQKHIINGSYTINTFGYGKDHDAVMMDDIAQLKDGSFYYIDKLSSVGACFSDCIGGLINIVAHSGTITIIANSPPQLGNNKIKIHKAFGGQDLWQYNRNQKTYTTKITHLYSGFGKEFVLELELDKMGNKSLEDQEKFCKVALSKCTITGMNNIKYNLKAELGIIILNEDDYQTESDESEHVALQYFRVKTAETISEAQKLATAEKLEEAKEVLQQMINIIWASKYKNINLSKALIQDLNASMSLNTQAMIQKARGHMQQRSGARGEGGQDIYENMQYEML